MDRRIEPARYNDKLGLILLYDGKQQGVTCISVLDVAQFRHLITHPVKLIDHQAGLPGDIDIETFAFALSNEMTLLYFLLRVESELIASMKRHIKQPVVIVEHGLGAIAMVDIPVKDTHPLQIEGGIEGYFCRQSCIIEEAET
jgi:hypothetical protein